MQWHGPWTWLRWMAVMESIMKKLHLHREPKESEARQLLKKELFAFNICDEYGFPSNPTAMDYDPKLQLLAVGTKNGDIRIYGGSGVYISGRHSNYTEVRRLHFIMEQARLVSICSDNSIHLWEINSDNESSTLTYLRSVTADQSKLHAIRSSCLSRDGKMLLVGSENGDLHKVDIVEEDQNVVKFALSEKVYSQTTLTDSASDEVKSRPGFIEAIVQHPLDQNKFLIGYTRGLIVLFDISNEQTNMTCNISQDLESLCFHKNGEEFISSHADGSYVTWNCKELAKCKFQSETPYGPYPCKAISKLDLKTTNKDPFIIFAGGMPRSGHGEKNALTIKQGQNSVVFDLTSKIVDFIILCKDNPSSNSDEPHTLIILAEQELVAIDLTTDGWPEYQPTKLSSIHANAITCIHEVSNVNDTLWQKLVELHEKQFGHYSTKKWPICGGNDLSKENKSHNLVLTGHDNGAVRFWNVSSTDISLLCKIDTSEFFVLEAAPTTNTDDWITFRKVGVYDPYTDDCQLSIRKITFCPTNEMLVVAGDCGQVIVLQFSTMDCTSTLKVETLNIINEEDHYVWKGHNPFKVKTDELELKPGFQPSFLVQLSPPSTCTALNVDVEHHLLAVGTAHGYGVFDMKQMATVLAKCTLSPAGLDASASRRRRSIGKSLRESFRRIRNNKIIRQISRSESTTHAATTSTGAAATAEQKEKAPEAGEAAKPEAAEAAGEQKEAAEKSKTDEGAAAAGGDAEKKDQPKEAETSSPKKDEPASKEEASPTKDESKETEGTPKKEESTSKEVESTPKKEVPSEENVANFNLDAKSTDDLSLSVVRCIIFAETFLVNAQDRYLTMWVGTNAGTVFSYHIELPVEEKRMENKINCTPAKDIHLKHHAPIVSLFIIDKACHPVSMTTTQAEEPQSGHQLIVVSEEQIKAFVLPQLRAVQKYKVLSHDNCRIRKADIASFTSKSDENYTETAIVCLTNTGNLHAYSLPHLRPQIRSNNFRSETINANTCAIVQNGEVFILASACEFLRLSLSALHISKPRCSVTVKDGIRATLPVEVTKTEEPQAVAAPPESAAEPVVEEQKAAPSETVVAAADESQSSIPADITTDNIVVHLSDEKPSPDTKNITSSKVVVTKKTVTTTTKDGTVTETTTDVQHYNSGGVEGVEGPAVIQAKGQ